MQCEYKDMKFIQFNFDNEIYSSEKYILHPISTDLYVSFIVSDCSHLGKQSTSHHQSLKNDPVNMYTINLVLLNF